MRTLIFVISILMVVSSAAMAKNRLASNRLANEASPYLRQHAHNPIHWYAWGKEALEAARKQNKPIFLSVGYSTCHWCHVMERESFEKQDVADILNKHFIAIKVDRERRPEIDETYMLATQMITGTGGWPNSVFLTPDKKPFYAGGYFPKEDFKKLLNVVASTWVKNEKRIREDAETIATRIALYFGNKREARKVTPDVLGQAVKSIMSSYDEFNGGFSTAPKFPNETVMLFLLHVGENHKDKRAIEAVTTTLDAMLLGGMYDLAGGGFHRYAVDNHWVIPHFEKMLYNQGLMSLVLVRAWQLTGHDRYKKAALSTLDFTLRQMLSPKGGFYSAIDADSKEGEGYYYTWSFKELKKALSKKEFTLARQVFDLSKSGNFEGRNILHFKGGFDELASEIGKSGHELSAITKDIFSKLLKIRLKRVLPHVDKKIVPEWNSLMIMALAEAGRVFDKPEYINAAKNAAAFIQNNMVDEKGELYRSFLTGTAELEATQVDYAGMINGLISLYDATGEKKWLAKAENLYRRMQKGFVDKHAGSFYMVRKSDTFTRLKSDADAPLPSGNGLALEVSAKLFKRTAKLKYRQIAQKLLNELSGEAFQLPISHGTALSATDRFLFGTRFSTRYAAKGNIAIKTFYQPETREIVVDVHMGKEWHINARKPLEDFFIPTNWEAVQFDGKAEMNYPKAVVRKLSFNDKPLALYEKQARFNWKLGETLNREKIFRSKFSFQACSDKICLEPETINLLHTLP